MTHYVGVMAEGGVCAAVKNAHRKGFVVTLVSDEIVSSRDGLRRFGLKHMQKAGASLKDCSEILQGT